MKGYMHHSAHSSAIYKSKGMEATQESCNRQMDKDVIYTHIHIYIHTSVQFSCSVMSTTPWTAASQASLSITNSWSLLKPMSIESVMPSSRLNLCRPLLLPSSIFPSIRVFSNESVLCIRWPKYWSFTSSIQSFQ